jgi:membrane-associated phospholipid phosphatase
LHGRERRAGAAPGLTCFSSEWMRRFIIIVIAVVALGSPLGAQVPSAPAPYRLRWWDAASVGAAGVLYVLPSAMGLPKGPPSCGPCDPATLPGFDRWAVHAPVSGPDVASEVVLGGVGVWTAVEGLAGLSTPQWRGNFSVFANTASWTAAATEWLKVLVRRNRPVLYTSGAAAALSDPENEQSFPSMHASLACAALTSYLVISAREHLAHRTRNAWLLTAGAVAVGALRIASAQHFPSDVAGGAALGAGLGWLVPTIYPIVQ